MSTSATAVPFEAIPTVPVSREFEHEAPRWLARMAEEHGPIFRVVWNPDFPWHPIYLVGPEANRFVLHTGHEHFSHELGWTPIIGHHFGKGILNMDGAEHARHRKLMNPAFTIAYMARYLPLMNRVIAERTRDWAERGEVDLYDETRRITFDVAAGALAGFEAGPEVDRMRELFLALLYSGAGLAVREELHGLLRRRIAARRAAPTDDLLSMLVHARDEDGRPLGDEQVLAHIDILLIAGHETSTTMSAWLLYLLAVHPAYLARVHAELDALLGRDGDGAVTLDAVKAMRALGWALDETGRLYPPVGNGPRGVVKDFQFAGYSVPAGARVRYSIAGGHWLPSVFAAPEHWDPDRFAPPREEDKRTPYALIPFGGGPRICIGVNFAQVEIKALAARVLRRYALEPVEGQDIAQYYGPTIGAPFGGIRVRVRPRD